MSTDPLLSAGEAAEALRRLDHATLLRTGYQWPSDVDAVVAELELVAARMEQALDQARRWLEHAHAAGRIGHDQGHDLPTVIADTSRSLRESAADARHLAEHLADAHTLTAHLTGLQPPAPDVGSAWTL